MLFGVFELLLMIEDVQVEYLCRQACQHDAGQMDVTNREVQEPYHFNRVRGKQW